LISRGLAASAAHATSRCTVHAAGDQRLQAAFKLCFAEGLPEHRHIAVARINLAIPGREECEGDVYGLKLLGGGGDRLAFR